jgi:hypothetical protein
MDRFATDETDELGRGRASYIVMSVLYLEEARRLTPGGTETAVPEANPPHDAEMFNLANEKWAIFSLRPN